MHARDASVGPTCDNCGTSDGSSHRNECLGLLVLRLLDEETGRLQYSLRVNHRVFWQVLGSRRIPRASVSRAVRVENRESNRLSGEVSRQCQMLASSVEDIGSNDETSNALTFSLCMRSIEFGDTDGKFSLGLSDPQGWDGSSKLESIRRNDGFNELTDKSVFPLHFLRSFAFESRIRAISASARWALALRTKKTANKLRPMASSVHSFMDNRPRWSAMRCLDANIGISA